ncbi:MAG: HEAT repeat domain-containing protein [Melioribacteraceae bacterium]|nr:HEAT repeat domain-containing protein [Melioribacteraceae bacterium]
MESMVRIAFLFTALAILITIALTFASIELPRVVDELIFDEASFVKVYTGGGELQDLKTELFIKHYHLRTIGYISLFVIFILIILGFITKRTGFAVFGAFTLFLPVFGHFAATMFFLGGLGFLRLLWLPGLDISFELMRLGDAVFIPYRIIIDAFNLIGINLYYTFPYIFIIAGLLIFCSGTITWFYSYYSNIGLAKSWIYKFSRHPQYLGWIIWSYGILFLPGVNMKQSFSISESLPWLISTLVIVGVAMYEEIKMVEKFGEEYTEYRKKSYFMVPFPKYFCRVISAPFRVFFSKNYPTRKKEIFAVLLFYFGLTILISFILNSTATMKAPGKWVFESGDTRNINELAKEFLETPNRRDKYAVMRLMLEKGDSCIPYFIELSTYSDPVIREFSVDALGIQKSENSIAPLIKSLSDSNGKVVRSALRSLGNYESNQAIEALINLLKHEDKRLVSQAAGALVRIGTEQSTNAVIPLAKEGIVAPNADLILALSKLGTQASEDLIIRYMNDNNPQIRRAAVIGAGTLNSERIVESLKKALQDNDWEVRLYADEVLKDIHHD